MKTRDERFWSKVDGGDVDSCWLWTGKTNDSGYGIFRNDGKKDVRAHRWAYDSLIADIPVGLQIDHLCRTRNCVNPWHLEPVTLAENTRRGNFVSASIAAKRNRTHCPSGHEYTPENTRIVGPRKHRYCRTCQRNRARAARRAATT